MKKFSLLLLDANVVIQLFELGIWDLVVTRCSISLSRTIVDVEVKFYQTSDGVSHEINLSTDDRITIFDVPLSDADAFRRKFDPSYFEKMDPGETESLIHLMGLPDDCLVCSADKIVFRILGNLKRGHQGISLEELLQALGLGRNLQKHFSKSYRKTWTARGFEDSLGGIGAKDGSILI